MSEFFGRLETELRAAASRPPRRTVPVPAIAVAGLLALAVAPIVFVLGSGSDDPAPERNAADEAPRADGVLAPVGATMPKSLKRGLSHRPADSTVVATGVAPVAGPWQLETYEDPAGQCLGVFLVEADPETDSWFSAICPAPGRPPLPGFSAQAMAVPPTPHQKEYLVYGPTPEQSTAVQLTADGKVVERMETSEGPDDVPGDFYLMVLPPDTELDGRMEWLDEGGNPGDEGVRFRLP